MSKLFAKVEIGVSSIGGNFYYVGVYTEIDSQEYEIGRVFLSSALEYDTLLTKEVKAVLVNGVSKKTNKPYEAVAVVYDISKEVGRVFPSPLELHVIKVSK